MDLGVIGYDTYLLMSSGSCADEELRAKLFADFAGLGLDLVAPGLGRRTGGGLRLATQGGRATAGALEVAGASAAVRGPTRTTTPTPSPTASRSPTPSLRATPTEPPTATAIASTPSAQPGEDPAPVTQSDRIFYLQGNYNPGRAGNWMSQEAPEGEYVSAWEAARFYSGAFQTGANIPAGTTFACLNYVNGSGASHLLYLTQAAGQGVAMILDSTPLWVPPSYGAKRACLRAPTEAHFFGAEGAPERLCLEIRFQSPTAAPSTATRMFGPVEMAAGSTAFHLGYTAAP
jgi:hypothetical protein